LKNETAAEEDIEAKSSAKVLKKLFFSQLPGKTAQKS